MSACFTGRLRFLIISLVLISSEPALSAKRSPPLSWSPDRIESILEVGKETTSPVSLYSKSAVGNVTIIIPQELRPYLEITPSSLLKVKARSSRILQFRIRAGDVAKQVTGNIQVVKTVKRPKAKPKLFLSVLPVSISVQLSSLQGADADENGVWDYVDAHINDAFANDPPARAAAQQFAKSLQAGLLDSQDRDVSLSHANELMRAIECMYARRENDAGDALDRLQAIVLNTPERSRRFVQFNNQAAGQSFPSVPYADRVTSCN